MGLLHEELRSNSVVPHAGPHVAGVQALVGRPARLGYGISATRHMTSATDVRWVVPLGDGVRNRVLDMLWGRVGVGRSGLSVVHGSYREKVAGERAELRLLSELYMGQWLVLLVR